MTLPTLIDPKQLPPEAVIRYLDVGKKSWIAQVENFLPADVATQTLATLIEKVPWRRPLIRSWGRVLPQPRGTALYGDRGLVYAYTNTSFKALPWEFGLDTLRDKVALPAIGEGQTWTPNVCLANFYKDGKDSVSFHADDEVELGVSPQIVSLSFGETRTFSLKHRKNRIEPFSFALPHNSLLIMGGLTQATWLHSIPKCKSKLPRVNLTFRYIEQLAPYRKLEDS